MVEMKELAPPNVNMKRLLAETQAAEPILIIISPGADPSQELEELAKTTVGLDKYHQVNIHFKITSLNCPVNAISHGCDLNTDIWFQLSLLYNTGKTDGLPHTLGHF